MFTRILVPLDGSDVAERALPLAKRLAQTTGAQLRLAYVHQKTPVSLLPLDVASSAAGYDRYARAMEEGYLRETANRIRSETGVVTTWRLLDGRIAKHLADEVREFAADLVVMTTHGRGPVSRFWMGSVADELIRTLEVPVMLLRADVQPDRVMPRRILVPLDGSPRAETALDFATQLAKLTGGVIELLQVVPPIVPMVLDGSPMTPAIAVPLKDNLLRDSARDYLESCARRLRDDGLEVLVTVMTDVSPARAIVDVADRSGADLIAIATHGAGGIRRMVLGSVTDKVLRTSPLPMLVFRPAAHAEPAQPALEAAPACALP